MDFYRWWQKHFHGGKQWLNFSFTNSKLRKKYFQISKFGGSSPRPPCTPSNNHENEDIMYTYDKQLSSRNKLTRLPSKDSVMWPERKFQASPCKSFWLRFQLQPSKVAWARAPIPQPIYLFHLALPFLCSIIIQCCISFVVFVRCPVAKLFRLLMFCC